VHALAFWFGAAASAAGVCLHLPMFFGAASMHYVLAGMPIDPLMILGMALIGAGLIAVVYGLSPTREQRRRRVRQDVSVGALDDTRVARAHLLLAGTLVIAIAIDAMKPFTFAFVVPGTAVEYHLSSPGHAVHGALPVALYPFVGIVGTVLGSLMWGYAADRLGRRPTILIAAILFMSTSICGAMPAFTLNLTMCFFMGLGAGGLLPIAYALLSETIPARQRGALVVLVAGIGTGLGFVLTSALATWLIPVFSWRIMWFLGLPTGVIVVLLNRFIPESPRYLIENGRADEARAVMHRFGVRLVHDDIDKTERPLGREAVRFGLSSRRLSAITAALVVYGLGWGVVNFGFLTWLPTDVTHHGFSIAHVSGLITQASLFSLLGSIVVAFLYGRWSAKWTMVLVAALTAASLVGFAVTGEQLAQHTVAFAALLVCLLVAFWGVISVLAPYSAEVYPTRLRARGAGIAAGASKVGGVAALGMAVGGVAPPALGGAAALTALVMALGAVAIGATGIETRGRRLEEIAEPAAVEVAV
jgi:putative MFS transporter